MNRVEANQLNSFVRSIKVHFYEHLSKSLSMLSKLLLNLNECLENDDIEPVSSIGSSSRALR